MLDTFPKTLFQLAAVLRTVHAVAMRPVITRTGHIHNVLCLVEQTTCKIIERGEREREDVNDEVKTSCMKERIEDLEIDSN